MPTQANKYIKKQINNYVWIICYFEFGPAKCG